ncbi:MAG: phosphoethanolamine transferase CptA [Zoogloeaceae bacterium]|jgi:heptose-I-phosphate ethanolaminephosphotransferase|nr:phosphoethanolamine transferase CptA [Zoogloeaceae bacterium]
MSFEKRSDWPGFLVHFLFIWSFSGLPQILYLFAGKGRAADLLATFPLSGFWLAVALLLPRGRRFALAAIGLTLWAASLVSLGYFGIHGDPITQSVVFAMFESNPEESREFFSQYFNLQLIGALALYSGFVFLFWKRLRPLALSRRHALPACALLLVASVGYPLMQRDYTPEKAQNRINPAMPWQLLTGFHQYHQQLAHMQNLLAGKAPPLANLKDANGDTPRTLVLVIGESTTSRHMSLYGYPRQTSPRLETLRAANKGLTVFEDVIAPRPYTIETLQQALTFAHQEEPRRFLDEPTLINLMQQAGYKTFWITNQQTMERDSLLTIFARQSDEVHYLNRQFQKNANQVDLVTLTPFAQALQDPTPKKFIVVHLLGAHMKYKYRYPKSFDRYQGREHTPPDLNEEQLAYYNAYDNAVLYNDFIVSRLIETFEAGAAHGFLLYFSDHGEEVFDTAPHQTLGRNEDAPTPGMYKVPFILWTSPSWQATHPRDFRGMTGRKYSTTHLIHTWSDLAGLSYDRYQPEWSVTNPEFTAFTRWIGNPDGELKDFDAGQ